MGQGNVLCTIHGWQVRLLLQSRTKWAAGGEEGGCLMTAQRARLACIRPETQILRRDHRILGVCCTSWSSNTHLAEYQLFCSGHKREGNQKSIDIQNTCRNNRADLKYHLQMPREGGIYPCCVLRHSFVTEQPVENGKK